MRRQLTGVSGSIHYVSMAEGLPVRFEPPARSVSFVGDLMALAILEGEPGDRNLLVLGPAGDELARLGTTCGRGLISQVLDVDGEVRAIEATSGGDFQARLDLATFEMERIAEWR